MLPDEPRGAVASRLFLERALKKRSEIELGVHLAVTADVLLVDESLVAGGVVEADKITGEGVALDGAIRALDHRELGLLANGAGSISAVLQSDHDVFTREELALEVVENPTDWNMSQSNAGSSKARLRWRVPSSSKREMVENCTLRRIGSRRTSGKTWMTARLWFC